MDTWPFCVDMDNADNTGKIHREEAGKQIAREYFQTQSIHNCSDVSYYCHHLNHSSNSMIQAWRARAYCPETCGCSNVSNQGYVATRSLTGCSVACQAKRSATLAAI